MSWQRGSTHTLFTIAVGLLVLIAGRSGCTAHAQPADLSLGRTRHAPAYPGADLTSWRPGASKTAIQSFVDRVTRAGSADFVPPAERIAVFDNDGTLWSEQPIYVQFAFAIDRVKALAPQHPEWTSRPPFNAVLAGGPAGRCEREWAYDRASSIGRLDRALDAAERSGWTVVDIARDWRAVYPFHK